MSFTYENQGTNTFLTYQIGENEEIDTMSLGMLTNNNIPGFAAASFMQLDMDKFIRYNVSSKVSAAQLFNGPVNKKRLLGLFNGIVDGMLAAEEYMLDPSTILLDLEHIFADVSTCEAVLICLPIMDLSKKAPDLGTFFKNIIFQTQFDQTENCDHVAKLLNYLNSTPVLSLADFKAVLTGIAKENTQPVKQPAVQKPVQQPAVQKPVQQPAVQQPAVQQPAVQQPAVQQPPVQQPPVQPMAPQPVQPVAQQPVQPMQHRSVQPATQQSKQQSAQPMTLMYLMQHYNKENAAIYKAQQEAQKAQKEATKKAPKQQAPKQNAKKVAVPAGGKPAAPGYAIPGQQPAPGGFAIPGQQPGTGSVQPSLHKPTQPAAQNPTQQPVVQKPVQQPVVQPPVAQPAASISFGETTVLGGGNIGETTVLGAAAVETAKVEPYLTRIKNNEKIPLNKPVYRIGKERSYVDYFIGDNTAISRSHANIINHNGEYFIVDTNSTNHTYVNGGMIQSNVETPLAHGTKIRLANEEFEFNLY